MRKKVVFASQAEQRRSRMVAIFRSCAELVNATQLPREEATLEIECFLIHVATELRRLQKKVVEDCLVFAWRFSEEPSAPLHELPRVRGAGEKKAIPKIRQIDPFVEATDGDNAIEQTASKSVKNLLSFGGRFAVREATHL